MMRLFKKKYTRSEWMEGLLEAEKFCKHSGYETAVLYLKTEVLGLDSDEHSCGWQDYIEHYQKYFQKA